MEQVTLGFDGSNDATLAGYCVPILSPQQATTGVAGIHRDDLKRDLNRLVSDIDI